MSTLPRVTHLVSILHPTAAKLTTLQTAAPELMCLNLHALPNLQSPARNHLHGIVDGSLEPVVEDDAAGERPWLFELLLLVLLLRSRPRDDEGLEDRPRLEPREGTALE